MSLCSVLCCVCFEACILELRKIIYVDRGARRKCNCISESKSVSSRRPLAQMM